MHIVLHPPCTYHSSADTMEKRYGALDQEVELGSLAAGSGSEVLEEQPGYIAGLLNGRTLSRWESWYCDMTNRAAIVLPAHLFRL
jgi:hypothetical protein